MRPLAPVGLVLLLLVASQGGAQAPGLDPAEEGASSFARTAGASGGEASAAASAAASSLPKLLLANAGGSWADPLRAPATGPWSSASGSGNGAGVLPLLPAGRSLGLGASTPASGSTQGWMEVATASGLAPEPAPALLALSGLAGLAAFGRRAGA